MRYYLIVRQPGVFKWFHSKKVLGKWRNTSSVCCFGWIWDQKCHCYSLDSSLRLLPGRRWLTSRKLLELDFRNWVVAANWEWRFCGWRLIGPGVWPTSSLSVQEAALSCPGGWTAHRYSCPTLPCLPGSLCSEFSFEEQNPATFRVLLWQKRWSLKPKKTMVSPSPGLGIWGGV